VTQPNYLRLLAAQTPTQFWNDSGEPSDVETALANGACGVTTNPILIPRTVLAHPDMWGERVRRFAQTMATQDIPHAVTAAVITTVADMILPVFARTNGAAGYVCAQCNPNNFNNAQAMVDEALAYNALRPNIANKIPVCAAGLEAIEELTSRGVTTTCTTSFTVPQALAIAEAFRRGLKRQSKAAAGKLIHCYAVIMAGRLDDHLRDEVKAGRGQASEKAITIAGLAVCKRAYRLFVERGYESMLLIGGMRGHYHVTELVGGKMVLTIAPSMQAEILSASYSLRRTIDDPVADDLVQEMSHVPDFRRAYEPDGMTPDEFSGFGAFVKTQGQFIESYKKLEQFVQESLTK
jgi:transaldolase